MDEREIRLRCIEAAAKSPMIHQGGPAAGVQEVARAWAEWVMSPPARAALADDLDYVRVTKQTGAAALY